MLLLQSWARRSETHNVFFGSFDSTSHPHTIVQVCFQFIELATKREYPTLLSQPGQEIDPVSEIPNNERLWEYLEGPNAIFDSDVKVLIVLSRSLLIQGLISILWFTGVYQYDVGPRSGASCYDEQSENELISFATRYP